MVARVGPPPPKIYKKIKRRLREEIGIVVARYLPPPPQSRLPAATEVTEDLDWGNSGPAPVTTTHVRSPMTWFSRPLLFCEEGEGVGWGGVGFLEWLLGLE
ncbi:hypothetical protein CRG98_030786 [Punica granatum]|uniref:Uncharacterized protein n=1 Tax=Punica granatum TaxID=22663 RepID=A0A2I0IXW1_PUNGR|nr:hypothetical protein CRG98_030786 [Punica granatum]